MGSVPEDHDLEPQRPETPPAVHPPRGLLLQHVDRRELPGVVELEVARPEERARGQQSDGQDARRVLLVEPTPQPLLHLLSGEMGGEA